MKKKSKILLGGVIALFLLLVVLIVIVLDPFKSDEEKVTSKIQSIGGTFYEDFFYPQQVLGLNEAQIAQKMTAFSIDGITISIEDINKVNEVKEKIETSFSEVTSNESKLTCDPSSTTVTVVPREPFGKSDYDVKVTLDCK